MYFLHHLLKHSLLAYLFVGALDPPLVLNLLWFFIFKTELKIINIIYVADAHRVLFYPLFQ